MTEDDTFAALMKPSYGSISEIFVQWGKEYHRHNKRVPDTNEINDFLKPYSWTIDAIVNETKRRNINRN